jgi:hypothetical protein
MRRIAKAMQEAGAQQGIEISLEWQQEPEAGPSHPCIRSSREGLGAGPQQAI